MKPNRVHPLSYARRMLRDTGRLIMVNGRPTMSTTHISFSLTERDLDGVPGKHETQDVQGLFGVQNEVKARYTSEYMLIGQHRGSQLRLSLFFPEVNIFDALNIASAYKHELIPLLNDEEGRRSFSITIGCTHLLAEARELDEFMYSYMQGRE